jgi:hypothetical protein
MRLPEAWDMTGVSARAGRPIGHPHFWQRALSRRQFFGAAAGATGAAVGAPLLLPRLALADEDDKHPATSPPRPIPGGIQPGLPGNPTLFHLFLPGHGAELSSITDFHGVIGVAALGGTGHDSGGSKPFDVDVRFFKGLFVATDGKHHHGTFGFVWLDVYESVDSQGNLQNQIHDFNPGIDASGLFWTVAIPGDAVDADFDDGEASLEVHSLHLDDYFNLGNALFGGGPQEIPAQVSYEVEWRVGGETFNIRDTTNHFEGRFKEGTATIKWSGREQGYSFHSDSSKTNFAEIGRESNGVFFDWVSSEPGAAPCRPGFA